MRSKKRDELTSKTLVDILVKCALKMIIFILY